LAIKYSLLRNFQLIAAIIAIAIQQNRLEIL
jgi:hypothetical protein